MARKGRRRVVAGVALLTLAGLVAAGVAYREDLRLEWWRRQAARDAMEKGFDPGEPTRAWKEILKAGEEGFPYLAKLLQDPRYDVWKAAVDCMDRLEERELRESPVSRFREKEACASILFRMAPRDQRAIDEGIAEWREGGDQFGREYWTGTVHEALKPFPEALEFLREVLAEVSTGYEPHADTRHFKFRALHALSCMEPEEGPNRLLIASAVRDPDPEVRLRALQAIGFRMGESRWVTTPTLSAWESFSLTGYVGDLGAPVFLDRASLRALVHLDHPRVLHILIRLQRRAEARRLLDEVLAGKESHLVPLPRWLPFHRAAGRFLMGPLAERLLAILAFADLPPEEGRSILKKHLADEPEAEVRLLTKGVLAVLGEKEHLEEVRSAFDERKGQRRRGNLLLLGQFNDWPSFLERLKPGYRADAWDLGILLARIGDRTTLEHLLLIEVSAAYGHGLNLRTALPLCLEGSSPSGRTRDWWESIQDGLRFDAHRRKWVVDR